MATEAEKQHYRNIKMIRVNRIVHEATQDIRARVVDIFDQRLSIPDPAQAKVNYFDILREIMDVAHTYYEEPPVTYTQCLLDVTELLEDEISEALTNTVGVDDALGPGDLRRFYTDLARIIAKKAESS